MPDAQTSATKREMVLQKLREMTEDKLRTEVIIPLLKSQGATHIELVHGAFEKGKDILYVHSDFHAHERLEVCQVKNQPFSGRAGKDNLVTVLSQLQQCRKIEVRNPANNKMERPRGVVLLSTYELPTKDTYGLDRFLKDSEELDCLFIGPEELLRKIEQHLPQLFDDLAFPGGGIFGILRRYVDIRHESSAFGIMSGERQGLKSFFINLGVSNTSDSMGMLASGRARPRSPESVRLEQMTYRQLEAQYRTLRTCLSGFEIFVKEDKRPLPAKNRLQASEVKQAAKGQGSADLKPIDTSLVKHVRLKEIKFEGFLRKAVQYISELRRLEFDEQNTEPSVRAELFAKGVSFIFGCSTFVESLSQALKKEDYDVIVPGINERINIGIEQLPAEALLALDESFCLVGEAGAGKTSVARELARVALDRNDPCIYFPCARLDSGDKQVVETIMEFLRGLSSEESLLKRFELDKVKWIIIDGCDEAASPKSDLSNAIAALAFPVPISQFVNREKKSPDQFQVPSSLSESIRFQKANNKLIQYRTINSFDYQLLYSLNEGTCFEAPLRALADEVKKKTPRVIVTTRESLELPVFKSFGRVRLAPLTDRQLDEFFARWFGESSDDARNVMEFLNQNPHIKDVCKTPIVATLVASLHQNGISLPLSKTDVYCKRFELLIERWDQARGVALRNRVIGKDKLVFLQRLALKLHLKHKRAFDISSAAEIWDNGISRHYPGLKIDDFLWELQLSNSLIVPEGEKKWSLGHLSYQEYLAAQAVVTGQHIKLLRDNYHNPRWRQVILFYAGITGDLTPLFEKLQSTSIPVSSQDGFLSELLAEARYTPEAVREFVADVLEEECEEIEGDDDQDQGSEEGIEHRG